MCKVIIVIMRVMITTVYVVRFDQNALNTEQPVQTSTYLLLIAEVWPPPGQQAAIFTTAPERHKQGIS